MLILQRRVDERILIGADIVITLVRIDQNKVRIGIDAPAHLLVDREEVRQQRNDARRDSSEEEPRPA